MQITISIQKINRIIVSSFTGFGITNGLWDRILNTDLTLKKLKEPLKW